VRWESRRYEFCSAIPVITGLLYRVIKRLCAPDDYSTKIRKSNLNNLNHHDNVVRIRGNIWR
jgi:hypothetical protein